MQELSHTLLSAERRQAILAALARDGKVVAARLVAELGVSEDTVRRDLRELAAQGLVQRVHGGALPPAPQPGIFAHRRETAPDAKAALAEAGVRVLGDAARRPARRLDDEPRARPPAARPSRPRTMLTNSPPIAAALADHPTAEVVMIGGRLDKAPRSRVGAGGDRLHPLRPRRRGACSASARCTPTPASRPTTSTRPRSSARWCKPPPT